jgi:hypothetical protein
MCQLAGFDRGIAINNLPTDLLPTMAIFRCFCCGGIVSELFLFARDDSCCAYEV